jgi:hypothetical protein
MAGGSWAGEVHRQNGMAGNCSLVDEDDAPRAHQLVDVSMIELKSNELTNISSIGSIDRFSSYQECSAGESTDFACVPPHRHRSGACSEPGMTLLCVQVVC